VENNHLLILHFNRSVVTMIEEFIIARQDHRRLTVVILGQVDPADVYHQLRPLLKNHRHIHLIVRKGDPSHYRDLQMVSIDSSIAILIASMHDMVTIKTLLAIKQTKFYDDPLHYGVCTIQHEKNINIAKDLTKDAFYILYLKELKTKILARTCLHPGLSLIYKNIFSFTGETLQFSSLSSLVGQSFHSVIQSMQGGYPLGIKSISGTVRLNPQDNPSIHEGDQLIVLTTHGLPITIQASEEKKPSPQLIQTPYVHSGKHVLLIGFNDDVMAIIQEMEKYVGKDSSLTMLVKTDTEKELIEHTYSKPLFSQVTIVVGETYSRTVLEQFNYQTFDTVGIFTNRVADQESADAESLLTLLHIHQLIAPLTNKPSIVLEIDDASNVDAMDQVGMDDFLVSDMLFSKMMVQMIESPGIYPVLEELISDTGQEFYLRRASAYLPMNTPFPFYEYVLAGLTKHHLVLGYKKHLGPIVLNPSKEEVIQFTAKDRLIVMAEF
jgi:ion channel POLLUX/CASTOR